ncbi:alpha/beta hydrolase [Aetokthonos hydrillicola Thurmond2011]|jgi:pimeloyl-ACP methyl ester carboxylesterase|uniref:Alpha/beta hydrolase n=1 Tax=Aetokthonos hydrillicola Thurmond2011 TaxID=2712845 RepID=A0AAP5M3S7_9CYAN|nr:alpha/beta hydrolase [Aetokthonos hydrillicola]MBO3462829.1 alpha/beta hydrolase [Aetokthonos hydrillicola CCALA 1050]MBW4585127.1 alpha/beta hydrolase [Aetokthonos hydrillicola CCALA 1050]MDR9894111.1 alpha/beta hydrolase [Aetokthonos hydrillicola Thurmond2011]
MSTNLFSVSNTTDIGGVVQEYIFVFENQQVRVVYETLGEGSPLLLLPAFSTVSMRTEMGEIGKLLSPNFQIVAVDWPGFGESSRLPVQYRPALYHEFLEKFVASVFKTPVAVVAAGHSAAYVLQLAKEKPHLFSRIVLVAPTWRGPLPTMGVNEQIAGVVRDLVRSPIPGQLLYKLNTAPSFLSFMYRSHVYVDGAKLTPSFIEYKWQNTQQPGARFAPAAFVTGNLDAVKNQADFLALARSLSVPLMVVIGESSPPKSRADMDALAALPGVQKAILPGSLGMHEEYPEAIVGAIQGFLVS